MITRVRIEAEADSIEQAKREIDILAKHVQEAAFLEGIAALSDSPVGDEVYERATTNKAGRLRRLFKGRQVVRFGENEVQEGGVKQYGFRVLDTDAGASYSFTTSWTAGTFTHPLNVASQPGTVVSDAWGPEITNECMVLKRVNPASRAHTWETEPPVVPELPPRAMQIAVEDDATRTIHWEDKDPIGMVAFEAAKLKGFQIVTPEQATEPMPLAAWTFKLPGLPLVLNPSVDADEILSLDKIDLEIIEAPERNDWGALGLLVSLEEPS